MDSAANESQHSGKESNTRDLQHFLNDQTDSNVTSKDSLQKNIVQRSYHQKNLTIINSPKRDCLLQEKVGRPTQAPRNEYGKENIILR